MMPSAIDNAMLSLLVGLQTEANRAAMRTPLNVYTVSPRPFRGTPSRERFQGPYTTFGGPTSLQK